MASSEKFCLRWNDFETNISVAFRELREEKDFFDVTLACDDNQIQAHKVILSACSPFFRNILRRNPHQHPLLYLKGVKYQELQSVLNFMYHGEVNVAQEELNSFLTIAEDLCVKGLTQSDTSNSSKSSKTESSSKVTTRPPDPPERDSAIPSSFKRPRQPPAHVSNTPTSQHQSYQSRTYDDEIQEVVPVKSEPTAAIVSSTEQYDESQDTSGEPIASEGGGTLAVDESYTEESYDDYGQYGDEYGDDGSNMIDQNTGMPISGANGDGNKVGAELQFSLSIKSKMVKEADGCGGVIWKCVDCGHVSKRTTDLSKHIEAKHLASGGYNCVYCGKHCPSKNALTSHISRNHRGVY